MCKTTNSIEYAESNGSVYFSFSFSFISKHQDSFLYYEVKYIFVSKMFIYEMHLLHIMVYNITSKNTVTMRREYSKFDWNIQFFFSSFTFTWLLIKK